MNETQLLLAGGLPFVKLQGTFPYLCIDLLLPFFEVGDSHEATIKLRVTQTLDFSVPNLVARFKRSTSRLRLSPVSC
jgi:hypothetical protein